VNAKEAGSMLPRAATAMSIVIACFLPTIGADCSMTLAEAAESPRINYGMPERLGRQVAPTPNAPWIQPDLSGYSSLLKTAELSPIDPIVLWS
jgi:hypothetical protein